MTTLRHGLIWLLCSMCSIAWASTPFWGDRESQPVDTAPEALEPGQFVWNPDAAPEGPVVVMVSLDQQLARVYRNGIAVGWANISAGKRGHETPTGVFVTLQKDRNHRSSTYNNAPMPFTQRLTWDGVALHAGGLPGYPSSHGCVHLPSVFAEALFDISPKGMTVVVSDEHSAPVEIDHPTLLAPVDPASGKERIAPRLSGDSDFRWTPDAAPEGPVSILASSSDRRVLVLRNGVEIGRARFGASAPDKGFGSHVYMLWAVVEGKPQWVAAGVPGHHDEAAHPLDTAQVDALGLPEDFVRAVAGILEPGATLMVTDATVLPHTTGTGLTVLANGVAAQGAP